MTLANAHDDPWADQPEGDALPPHDASLFFSGPLYLSRITAGLRAVLLAIAFKLVWFILAMLAIGLLQNAGVTRGSGGTGLGTDIVGISSAFVGVVLNSLLLWGWWRFTEPAPADPAFVERRSARDARWVVRLSVVASIVFDASFSILSVLSSAAATGGPTGATSLTTTLALLAGFGSLGAFLTRFVASLLYVRRLAARVPDNDLEQRAGAMVWVCPIWAVIAGWFLGVGLAVALVMYWNTLERARKTLVGVAAHQARFHWEVPDPAP